MGSTSQKKKTKALDTREQGALDEHVKKHWATESAHHWDPRHEPLYRDFYVGAGDPNRFFMFMQEALYQLSHPLTLNNY